MPWVTEEEIQAAKNMTAYEYLRTHQAQRLQKTRTRNEWQLTDHDSFKINELRKRGLDIPAGVLKKEELVEILCRLN